MGCARNRSAIGGPPDKKAALGRPCSLLHVRRRRRHGAVMQTTRAWAPSAIPTVDFLLHDFGRADKLHAVKSHVGGVPAHFPGIVMAGHRRSKNGVASLAYVPAIHVFAVADAVKTWMPGTGRARRSAWVSLSRSCFKRRRWRDS